jgi:hypothetical protein
MHGKCYQCDNIVYKVGRHINKYCSPECKSEGMKLSTTGGTIRLEFDCHTLAKRKFTGLHHLRQIYSRWLEVYKNGEIIVTFN